MIVVADAGPLQYLVRIGAIDVLPAMYQRVLVPQSVARELQQSNTPAPVRAWMVQPPAWCEIRPDPPGDAALAFLGPGERAAIALALAVDADRLLIDDLAGRGEAIAGAGRVPVQNPADRSNEGRWRTPKNENREPNP